MTNFIEKDLKKLIANEGGISISIVLPIAPPGQGDEKNKIKFKNLLQKSEDELSTQGLKKAEIDALLKEIKESAEHPAFFRSGKKGMVVFINKNFTRIFNVPYDVQEKSSVGDVFFIKPLLPLIQGNGEYFVLAINKDRASLYSADKSNIFEVDISTITQEADKEIEMMTTQKHFNYHAITGGAGAIFHGQDSSDLERNKVTQYFRLVSEGLRDILNKHNYPLVLAGIEYLHPIYQEVNKYHNILKDGVYGNPDDIELSVIHERSWKIVEPLFKEGMKRDAKIFRTLNGTGNASSDINEIATKAEYGQVDSLFINPNDLFDGDCRDVLNMIAINTLKNNGKIYGIDTSEIFNNISVAATYRY